MSHRRLSCRAPELPTSELRHRQAGWLPPMAGPAASPAGPAALPVPRSQAWSCCSLAAHGPAGRPRPGRPGSPGHGADRTCWRPTRFAIRGTRRQRRYCGLPWWPSAAAGRGF